MSYHDATDRILAFAQQCGRPGRTPEAVAETRGWIDGQGAPTDEGHALLRALDEQEATRTVFRTLP